VPAPALSVPHLARIKGNSNSARMPWAGERTQSQMGTRLIFGNAQRSYLKGAAVRYGYGNVELGSMGTIAQTPQRAEGEKNCSQN